jgi:hypothetical protein
MAGGNVRPLTRGVRHLSEMSLPGRQSRRPALVVSWLLSGVLAGLIVVKPHLLRIPSGFGPLLAFVAISVSVLSAEFAERSGTHQARGRRGRLYVAVAFAALGLISSPFVPRAIDEPHWRSMALFGLGGALLGYSLAHAFAPIVNGLRSRKGA